MYGSLCVYESVCYVDTVVLSDCGYLFVEGACVIFGAGNSFCVFLHNCCICRFSVFGVIGVSVSFVLVYFAVVRNVSFVGFIVFSVLAGVGEFDRLVSPVPFSFLCVFMFRSSVGGTGCFLLMSPVVVIAVAGVVNGGDCGTLLASYRSACTSRWYTQSIEACVYLQSHTVVAHLAVKSNKRCSLGSLI